VLKVPELYLATGNPDKASLFASQLRGCWSVRTVDPGDAEARCPVGYQDAARAKADAARINHRLAHAVGHDSGFEFADLDWRPGPLTARWLRTNRQELGELRPGSAVRVVHCVAVSTTRESVCFLATDLRWVKLDFVDLDRSRLPLTGMTDGPVTALATAAQQAEAYLSRLLDESWVGSLLQDPTRGAAQKRGEPASGKCSGEASS
jgi:hypothetical protein